MDPQKMNRLWLANLLDKCGYDGKDVVAELVATNASTREIAEAALALLGEVEQALPPVSPEVAEREREEMSIDLAEMLADLRSKDAA